MKQSTLSVSERFAQSLSRFLERELGKPRPIYVYGAGDFNLTFQCRGGAFNIKINAYLNGEGISVEYRYRKWCGAAISRSDVELALSRPNDPWHETAKWAVKFEKRFNHFINRRRSYVVTKV